VLIVFLLVVFLTVLFLLVRRGLAGIESRAQQQAVRQRPPVASRRPVGTAPTRHGGRQPQKAKKATIPQWLRYSVFERDQFRCLACGVDAYEDIFLSLNADHIVPESKGGPTSIGNLQTLCRECNAGKGNRSSTNLLTLDRSRHLRPSRVVQEPNEGITNQGPADDEVAQGLALIREAASTEWWVTSKGVDLWSGVVDLWSAAGRFARASVSPEDNKRDPDDVRFAQQCELIAIEAWTRAMAYECWSMLGNYKSLLAENFVDFDSIPEIPKAEGDGRKDARQIEQAIEATGWGWKELLMEDRPISEIKVSLVRTMSPHWSSVPHKMRFEVLKRDGFCCKRCGASPRRPGIQLVVDKIQRGEVELENVQAICTDCVLQIGPQLWDY
jgi:5-methylcytosine-specific restriction endonuclease McrA